MQSIQSTETPEDEIDLLDLLIVVADNLKLLIIGPIVAGLVGLAIAFALQPTYESVSILNPVKSGLGPVLPPSVISSFIQSADTLEKVGNQLKIAEEKSATQRLREMEKRVSVSAGKQDGLVTLTTRGPSPEAAQQLNNAMWAHLFPLTLPPPKEMERFKEQIQAERQRLASGVQLEQATAKLLQNGTTSESSARLYGELLRSNSDRQQAISKLESQLEGLSAENLTQKPTLPEVAVKPKKPLIAIAAALGFGML